MDDFLSFIRVKKNLINLLVLGIIVLSIPIGVNLIQSQSNLFLGAAANPITIEQGKCIKSVDSSGKAIATCGEIPLKLTSPYGGPAPAEAAATTQKLNFSEKDKIAFQSEDLTENLSNELFSKVDAASNTCGRSQDIKGVSADCGQITNINIANNGETKGDLMWQPPTTNSSQTSCTIRISRDRDCDLSGPSSVTAGSGAVKLSYNPVCDTNTSDSGCKWTVQINAANNPNPPSTPPPSQAATGSISANPNPCTLNSTGSCTSTITWSTQNATDPRVMRREDNVIVFAGPSGSQPVDWISQSGYTFDLYDRNPIDGGTVLASVRVTGNPASTPTPVVTPPPTQNPSGTISANPTSCTVNTAGTCSTTISWSTQNADNVWVTVRENPGSRVSTSSSGSTSVNYITEQGATFDLYANNGSTLLASVRVVGNPGSGSPVVTPAPTPTPEPPSGTISANPTSCTVNTAGTCSTTISWSTQNANNVVVLVDGSLNSTLGKGPAASQSVDWITETGATFGLYADSGATLLSSVRVVGSPNTALVPTGTISANPTTCAVNATGRCTTTITWNTTNARDVVVLVDKDLNSTLGKAPSASVAVDWVTQRGASFDLYANGGATFLASVNVIGTGTSNAAIFLTPASGAKDASTKIDISTQNVPAGAVCKNNWNGFFYNDRVGTGIFPANTVLSDTRTMSASKTFEITCTLNGEQVAHAKADYTVIPAPSAPNLSLKSAVSCQTNKISTPLTWTASTNATSYEIFRSDILQTQNKSIGTSETTSYTDNLAVANSLIGQQIIYSVVARGPGGATNSNGLEVTVPDCRPIATVSYRLASTQAALGAATVQPYTAYPLAANFQIPETPGTHQIWVQYLNNKGIWSTPENVNIDLLEKPPVISAVDCRIDIGQNNVAINVTGLRFGQKIGSANVKANNSEIKVNSWTATQVAGVLQNQNLDPKTGQEYKVKLTRSDGQTAPSSLEPEISCKIGVSQISLGAKLFCRAPSQHDQQNVEITLVSEDGQVIKEKVTIDKTGVVQGLTSKLESGRNYVLSLKSPKGLRRNATFKAGSGTTVVVGLDGNNFILPVGDIFPVDGGDGRITTQDKAELNRQIRLLTAGQNLSADFNLDSRVNSIDYACMRYDFGKSDDIVPKQAPSVNATPAASSSPLPSSSTSPSPSASAGT